MDRRKVKTGFTLIELLVVISIIALLLSILMPSLQKAKQQAQAVVCRSNLSQLGLASFMYADGNKGNFFAGSYCGRVEDEWMFALKPYYGTEKVRICPTASTIAAPKGHRFGPPWAYGGKFKAWGNLDKQWEGGKYGSYTLNGWVTKPSSEVCVEANGFSAILNWKNIDKVKSPASVPIFTDGMWVDARPKAFDLPPAYNADPTDYGIVWWQLMATVCLDRHSGGVNAVFLDSSVQKIKLKELWGIKWHRGWDTEKSRAGEPVWPDWMRK